MFHVKQMRSAERIPFRIRLDHSTVTDALLPCASTVPASSGGASSKSDRSRRHTLRSGWPDPPYRRTELFKFRLQFLETGPAMRIGKLAGITRFSSRCRIAAMSCTSAVPDRPHRRINSRQFQRLRGRMSKSGQSSNKRSIHRPYPDRTATERRPADAILVLGTVLASDAPRSAVRLQIPREGQALTFRQRNRNRRRARHRQTPTDIDALAASAAAPHCPPASDNRYSARDVNIR